MGRSRIATAAAVGIVAAWFMGACAAQAEEEVVYQTSYPVYGTASDLADAASLIIIGSVVSSEVREIDIAVPPSDPDDPQLNPALGAPDATVASTFVFTVHQVEIEEVLGGQASVGDVIEVSQLGGQFRGRAYREQGASFLQEGRSYALYLSTYDTGHPASILSPSQAVYVRTQGGGFESVAHGNPIATAVIADIRSRLER
jgi:hypothetical protein